MDLGLEDLLLQNPPEGRDGFDDFDDFDDDQELELDLDGERNDDRENDERDELEKPRFASAS